MVFATERLRHARRLNFFNCGRPKLKPASIKKGGVDDSAFFRCPVNLTNKLALCDSLTVQLGRLRRARRGWLLRRLSFGRLRGDAFTVN
jgi:hypothetical protein